MKQKSLEKFMEKTKVEGSYELSESWGYMRLGEVATKIGVRF